MPDFSAALIGIFVMSVATYLTRIAGYFLGDRIRRESLTGRVLESLPGAALASVLALSLSQANRVELIAVVVAVLVYRFGGRTLPAIGAGLLLTVGHAHLIA